VLQINLSETSALYKARPATKSPRYEPDSGPPFERAHRLVPTVFHEPWWMDIAAEGRHGEAVVTSGGSVVGRLPYACTRRFPSLQVLGMPMMTHVLGPAFAPQHANAELRSLKQLSITRNLISQLPRAVHVSFRMHAGIADTLAFGEAGFRTSVDFTVEIPPAPADTIWRQMRDKTRNVIRRAREQHSVADWTDPAQFIAFYEGNLRERGLKNHYDGALSRQLIQAALAHGAGRIIVARDPAGTAQGAVFTIWDDKFAYYFMSTRAKGAMNGVVNLLIWEAIQHAIAKNLIFDMDLLHVKKHNLPNHLMLTGFGGTIKPRFVVSRSAGLVKVARGVFGE
jgi:hypothetical protein